jgi:3-oxoacyl-[acyl-carrier protein] reductase
MSMTTATTLGRYGRPAKFAQVVAFYCTPAASYVTGVTVVVDDGKSKGLVS